MRHANQICVRHVPVGHRFLLLRTNEKFTMLKVERQTPGCTQYFVRNDYTQSNGTLNPQCHVVLFGKNVIDLQKA